MNRSLDKKTPGLIAVLDNIRSLHNVGSIFRTADGAGFDVLILCGITGQPPRNEIRKAALGAEEFVPWKYEKNILDAISGLRDDGYLIVALEKTESSVLLQRIQLRRPLALILGNEYYGLSQNVLAAVDVVAHIPMHGQKISLNVGVAFGVAAYSIQEQLSQSG